MGEIWRLLSLAKPEKKTLTIAGGLLLVSSAVTMSVPFTFGRIIVGRRLWLEPFECC